MTVKKTHVLRLLIPLLPLAAVGCDRSAPKPEAASGNTPPALSAPAAAAVAGETAPAEPAAEPATPDPVPAPAVDPDRAPSKFSAEAAALLKDSEKWQEGRKELYEKWAKEAPKAALLHAKENNPGASTQCVGFVLSSWLAEDSKAPLEWLAAQPDNAERSIWLDALIASGTPEQLTTLGELAAKGIKSPRGAQPVASAVKRLFLSDETAGAGLEKWLDSSFQEDADRTEGAKIVMREWTQLNEESASKWLNEVPKDKVWRDEAIGILVRQIGSTDAASAKVWAETVKDQTLRETLLGEIAAIPAK